LIRVTPDTNVLVSAFFYEGNERAVLQAGIDGTIQLVVSQAIIDELIRVLEDKFKLDAQLTAGYVLRLNEVSEIVKPRRLPDSVIRDRDDAKIIECAQSGRSNYMVTGDADLLSVKRYRRTKIVSPHELLKTLK
jgi:putative PIN family toxin of toxin-antitoxin system